MIAYERNYPPAKRQKRSLSPPPLFYDETSSLGGIEDHYDDEELEMEEESDRDLEREETLLDRVLMIFDQYEEDSLVHQSSLRSQLRTCGISKMSSVKKELRDEKVKCSLFKVLTLLLQSDSRLKGSTHRERVDLMRQVRHILQEHESYTLDELKLRFRLLFSSLRKELFPPCAIMAPSFRATASSSCAENMLDHEELVRATRARMSQLEQTCNEAIQQRLLDSDYSNQYNNSDSSSIAESEGDWDNMREVWYIWLQYPTNSAEQRAVWQETLANCESLETLLWNLAFCLSIG